MCTLKTICILNIIFSFFLLSAVYSEPQYPRSNVIDTILFDTQITHGAPGSDLWPVTWADDDHLYTCWGDGGGFGGTNSNGRVSHGVGRVEGPGSNWSAYNVWGGYNPEGSQSPIPGKAHGIICVNSVLYIWLTKQADGWDEAKVVKSADHGMTWQIPGSWTFSEPNGYFAGTFILQFGKNYSGVPPHLQGYVYGYDDDADNKRIIMFRVPVNNITDRSAYEFFAGLNNGQPVWSKNISDVKAVFSNPDGISWGSQIMYHPVFKRYLLIMRKSNSNSPYGIFDAPEPWGPWTTIAYEDKFLDNVRKHVKNFTQKWMSADGKTIYLVWSGGGMTEYDRFNVTRATFVLKTVELNSELPEDYGLILEAYPNPFHPAVVISVADVRARQYNEGTIPIVSPQHIAIYDIHGRKVDQVTSRDKNHFIWKPSCLTSGIYILRLQMETKTISKRLYYTK